MSLVEITKDTPYPQYAVFGFEIEDKAESSGIYKRKSRADGCYSLIIEFNESRAIVCLDYTEELYLVYVLNSFANYLNNPNHRITNKELLDLLKLYTYTGAKGKMSLRKLRVLFTKEDGSLYKVRLLREEEAYPTKGREIHDEI